MARKKSVVKVEFEVEEEVWQQVEAISRNAGMDINYIVNDALKMWLLQADPITGLKMGVKLPAPLQPPEPPICPKCGAHVIPEESKYAPAGFCLVCGEVTVSKEQCDLFLAEMKLYEKQLQEVLQNA